MKNCSQQMLRFDGNDSLYRSCVFIVVHILNDQIVK